MTQRVIGLDVGTHAITASELKLGRGGQVTITRFGQVAIKPGAVVGGEVVDQPEVSAAIKRLWREAGFSSKRVVVGVGNQRVVVRPTEMPAMNEQDLRSAVEFQAQELIPIPLDEAVLDYQLLERFTSEDGDEMLRVLIVAAQREMVQGLIGAVSQAGLDVTMVDLVPFALLRSLVDLSGFEELDVTDATGEAIISVGAGVTTILVHEFGIPRFIRIVGIGSSELTQAIADELDISVEEAEGLKRQVTLGMINDPRAETAAAVIERRVSAFVEEIKGSLEFHTSQANAAPLGRVIITGGGRRVPGLADKLGQRVQAAVVVGSPLSRVELGKTNLTPEQLRDAEDVAAVSLGLALAGRPVERGARRLTLLPPEINEAREQRRKAVLVGAGVCVVAAGLLWLGQSKRGQAEEAEQRARAEEFRVAELESRVAELQPVAQFEQVVGTRQALVENALAGDIAWTKLVQEVATVMPDDTWITAFIGKAPTSNEPGTIQISGNGFDHTSSARWLMRLESLESMSGLWLPASVRRPGGDEGDLSQVAFSSSAVLTERAQTARLERYLIDGSDDVTIDVEEVSVLNNGAIAEDQPAVEEG
ncbi:MAG: type IV pilus assembly protein PilM [Actinomycetia bacterium]|nr:type IV pilus assembly protein PilM [Actinomycetes bacterium]MCP4958894.1 type IV pilus assembly protein PilM [Actinomycetes bacterium]